jgi:hypothetical protein
MPAPISVDVHRRAGVIGERDLDARLVMLIIAARVTSALEAIDGTADSDPNRVTTPAGAGDSLRPAPPSEGRS